MKVIGEGNTYEEQRPTRRVQSEQRCRIPVGDTFVGHTLKPALTNLILWLLEDLLGVMLHKKIVDGISKNL